MANELDAFRGQLSPELLDLLGRELFSDDEAQARTVVWRPAAVGDAAAGPSVYVGLGAEGFAEALEAAQSLRKYGQVTLELDGEFSGDVDNFGDPSFRIPSSADQPGGVWNLKGLLVTNTRNSSIGFGGFTTWHLVEGCVFDNFEFFLAYGRHAFVQDDNVTTTAFGIQDSPMAIMGGRQVSFWNWTNFSGNPGVALIKADNSFAIQAHSGCKVTIGPSFGGFNPINNPIVDLAGGTFQIQASQFMIRDFTIEDTVGGGEVSWQQNGNQAFARGGGADQRQSIPMDAWDIDIQRQNHAVNMSAYQTDTPISPSFGSGYVNRISGRVRIATDAGDIEVQAPNAAFGAYYGVDNEGASNKGVLVASEANQTVDGKITMDVPAKTRYTFRGDGGQNDNILVTYDNLGGGNFTASGSVDLSWAGGTGEILDDFNATTMCVRLVTGVAPVDDETLTQGGVTADTNGAPVELVPNWVLV